MQIYSRVFSYRFSHILDPFQIINKATVVFQSSQLNYSFNRGSKISTAFLDLLNGITITRFNIYLTFTSLQKTTV